jgi:polysaccharide biosynthesis transport protein
MVVTDYLRIRDYQRVVYRRRWIIIATMIAGLVSGVLSNWLATTVFEARATLQIDAGPNVLALDRPLMNERDSEREFFPTQLGILASRDLARMAQEELKLSDSGLPSRLGATPIPTVDEILKQRTIEAVKDTRLVNIGFRATDPVLAARLANALARAYMKRNLEFRSRATAEASDWLSQQVQEQRTVVDASEAALQRYREEQRADALFTSPLGADRQNIVVQKLAELQAAVSKARTETIEREAQYKLLSAIQADRAPLDTLPAIASNVFIQGLKGELSASQRQLEQASKELGERHPDIIKLQGAVQNAERKLQTEISNVVQAIRNDFEAAQSRERALAVALERQKVEVQDQNGKAVEYAALERQARGNREVLDKLLQRAKQASLEGELRSTNIAIVDSAEIPTLPILPRKARTVILALGGSGALALALVFLLEILDTRLTSPEDVKRHLRIPVLGMAPQVRSQHGLVSVLLSDGAPPQFAELVHGVRTNLVMAFELATARTLLVTSSEPGEGKTVTAANLAVSLAQLNERVLLIDADLRAPRLHELFGQERQPGLTEVLAGNDELSGLTTSGALRKTRVPRLWLMPSGSASRNPADLLGSARFNRLIDVLRSRFHWVVLDSPPVLAVTDACLIAHVASGVLFVVGCGQTSREVACAAVERLDAAGGKLVGALLNRAVFDQPGESYLPYYNRGYQAYNLQQEGSSSQLNVPDGPSKGDSVGAGVKPTLEAIAGLLDRHAGIVEGVRRDVERVRRTMRWP